VYFSDFPLPCHPHWARSLLCFRVVSLTHSLAFSLAFVVCFYHTGLFPCCVRSRHSGSHSRRNKKEKKAPESKILLTKRKSRHELMDLGILNVWQEDFLPEDPQSPYLIAHPCSGFHLELGQVLFGPPHVVVDDQDEDVAYYSRFFLDADHSHYVGVAEDIGPVVLSVLDSPHESANHGMLHCAFRSYKGGS
jgi:hypothetical protein